MYKKILNSILLIFPVLILAQTSALKFPEHLIESDFGRSAFSKAVDLDNDNDIDIVATAYTGDQLVWFENDGSQNFTKHSIDINFEGAYFPNVIDLDGDNDFDIYALALVSVNGTFVGEYNLYVNDGNQNFTKTPIPDIAGVLDPNLSDFDGDNDFDFVKINATANQISWFENIGNLNFTERTIPFDLTNDTVWFSSDLDGDLDIDILTKDNVTDEFKWHENINSQSFTEHTASFEYDPNIVGSFNLGKSNDVNGDGFLDLVVYYLSDNVVAWHENDGTQHYTKHIIDDDINYPFWVTSTDFDNDNDIDIIATAYTDDEIVWYENDGNQNFTKHSIVTNFNGPLGHFLVDIDNDSDIDVIGNGYLEDNLKWFENNLTSGNIDDYIYRVPTLGNYNYIYTISPQKAVTTLDSIKTNKDAIESVAYFDGLGRPIQNVAIRNGGNGEDLITPIEYDAFGRQVKEYLPFAKSSNSGEKYHSTVLDDLAPFYQTKYANDFTSVTNPYSEKRFEASPLNRILEQGAPGESWIVDKDNDTDHTIKFDYKTNDIEEVRLFEVTFVDPQNTTAPSLTESGHYNANELYKTITKDENWQPDQTNANDHTTEEFKDKQGRIVLKRTYNSSSGGEHDTYYVYDDYGNLTYVIPPKAANETTITQEILEELCYQYKYDYRNRLIEKKIPGKGIESIIYDNLDRPVLTQDANQQTNNEWLFTKYDALSRVVYTGIYNDSRVRDSIQKNNFNNKTADQNFEEKVTSGTGFEDTYYTNADFPNTNLEILTVNYYDDYDFAGIPFNPANNPETVFDKTTTASTKSLTTGTKVKVLETTDWITTVTYYDEKARPIYVYSQNEFLNTTDIVKTELDFVGKVLRTRTSHIINNEPEIVTLDTFTYDQAGRLLKQVQCIGDTTLDNDCGVYGADGIEETVVTTETVNPGVQTTIEASNSIILKPGFQAKPIAGVAVKVQVNAQAATNGETQLELIAENTYDELGQLVGKKVGNIESVSLQNIDYTYNVRGWLKNINQDTNNDNDLFNFRINYNDPENGATALYNGNISETFWKTANDNVERYYKYGYDPLNRILSATDNTGNYNLDLVQYDKNGNITVLKRQGHLNTGATNFGTMDDLTYSYDSGNKLMKVADAATIDQFGFKDDAVNTASDTSDDYSYDINGNLLSDTNKGISSITYNHFNMPTEIKFNNSNTQKINYIYAANRSKIRKIVNDNGNVTTTDYAGNYVYENGTLQFFNHEEGYVQNTNGVFSYVYQYLDHLGNVRLSYTDSDGNGTIAQSEIIEENNYYPFGLEHKGYNNVVNGTEHPYKYNGKEHNQELGLDWYDYGVRNYDPAIGRWMNIDPLAEVMYDQSTYNYAFNNPILYIDPDGALPWPIHIRSFISAKSVGGGTFRGDGRGASTQSSPNATSRVESSFTVDPAKGTVTDLTSRSDATIFYGTGPGGLPPMAKTPEPSSSISNVTTYDTKSAVSLDFEHSAKDPITPSLVTPDLDVQASLDVIENLGKDGSGLLSVTGTFTGDAFPSTEAFITDQSGKTQLLLGAHKEEGGLGKLFGENKRPTFTVNMMINVDKNGNFTGVTQGDKTYTVKEWNQKVKDEFY